MATAAKVGSFIGWVIGAFAANFVLALALMFALSQAHVPAVFCDILISTVSPLGVMLIIYFRNQTAAWVSLFVNVPFSLVYSFYLNCFFFGMCL